MIEALLTVALLLLTVAGIVAVGAVLFWWADQWLPDPPQPPRKSKRKRRDSCPARFTTGKGKK